ncbi:ALH_1b_G0036810.mRNA.1.CDS.1 [Saccharomyces cerevisiae]|nr:ALH_1b_G0036810.mRNA.1.CDS.1 [Saccharomyces cerevisiae]CAI6804454.1 ALH_1b_G0036810.mRNA.1.CDS.1 [Saccharomyces cerevisiae]
MSHSQVSLYKLLILHGLILRQAYDYWRINQITILKEEATDAVKKKPKSLFFHLFPLARRYLLSLETAEIPEELLFLVSLLPEISLFKSLYLRLAPVTIP